MAKLWLSILWPELVLTVTFDMFLVMGSFEAKVFSDLHVVVFAGTVVAVPKHVAHCRTKLELEPAELRVQPKVSYGDLWGLPLMSMWLGCSVLC